MKTNAEFGDQVNVKTTTRGYDGVYLPSPEKGSFLLKLENGYNIGFKTRDVMRVDVVKKKKEVKEHFEIVQDGSKPTIGVVILGGTIASKLHPGKGGVEAVATPEDFFRFYPELFDLVNVEIDVPFIKWSENMDFLDWKHIAKSVTKFLHKKHIAGVIVTHGTDFLHYTSAALSFFLRDLSKPVVLTYSQRSIDRASSDASLNLLCAAKVATYNIAEVCVVGHETVNDTSCIAIAGTKARKMHTSKRDAFTSVNRDAFLRVDKDIIQDMSEYNVRAEGKVVCDSVYDNRVALVKFYPGQDPKILDYYVKEGYRGLVIEMSGLGQVATTGSRKSWIAALKAAIKAGVVVCASAQTIYGRLNPLVYSAGRELEALGIVFLEDMLSETAFVKLGWVLGHEDWAKDKEIVREKMLHSFAHELNARIIR